MENFTLSCPYAFLKRDSSVLVLVFSCMENVHSNAPYKFGYYKYASAAFPEQDILFLQDWKGAVWYTSSCDALRAELAVVVLRSKYAHVFCVGHSSGGFAAFLVAAHLPNFKGAYVLAAQGCLAHLMTLPIEGDVHKHLSEELSHYYNSRDDLVRPLAHLPRNLPDGCIAWEYNPLCPTDSALALHGSSCVLEREHTWPASVKTIPFAVEGASTHYDSIMARIEGNWLLTHAAPHLQALLSTFAREGID